MTTTKLLSLTLLLAGAMGVCGVSSAEEVKDSTSTQIVSAEDSDLRNEEALRVAVGDFDDVEFLLSADEMATIADNANVSLNGISAQGYERSVTSMFSAEALERVGTTQGTSSTFNGALTLAPATNTYETVTVRQSAVATTSPIFDNSTEQYAVELQSLDKGRDGVGTLISSDDSGVSKETGTISFLGNFDSIGDTNGSYGISYLSNSGGAVPFAATDRTWTGSSGTSVGSETYYYWDTSANWSSSGWVNGDNATFDANGSNKTVTVNTAIAANNLNVTDNYTFNYTDEGSLSVTGTSFYIGAQNVSGSLTITGGTNIFSVTQIYVGNAGEGTLTIDGGTNTFSALYIGHGNANGSGTVTIRGGTNTFSGTVNLGQSCTGTLEIKDGTNTFSGAVYVSYNSSGTGVVTISGGENKFSSTVYVGYNNAGTMTIEDGTNEFSSTVSVGGYKTGSLTINSGTNTFSGAINIGSSGYSTANTVTITGGTTTISGATTIYDGSTLTIGGGTLTIEQQIGTSTTGSVTISGNAQIIISGELLNSIATLVESGEKGSIAVISANTISFGDVSLSDYYGDLDSLINAYVSAEGYDLTWNYDSGVLSVVAAVAPEPSMFGLFFGLGAIGLVATRRRRVA